MVKLLNSFLEKKERDIIMAGVNKLTRDDLFYSQEEQEEWDRWMQNSMEDRIRKQGHEQGLQQGIEQNIKNIIIALTENDASLEFISKITGKTIEEIQEILK